MTSLAASSSSSPAALLLAELSQSTLSDGSLQLLVRLVGGPVDASGSGPNPANRMRLIASISKAATEVDQTKAIEVDEAGWEVVGPTPLHTPPTSPITAMRGLPRPSSATNPAQRLMASTEDDSSWNAPRWTPACLLPPTNIAQPSAMSVDAQPIPGDDWSAPPWAIKARETDGLNEGWKAPRWARSPSPQTATRNQDAYVESWRAEAAPFAWSPPKLVPAKRPSSSDSQNIRRRAPQVAPNAEHWVPPSWAFVEA